MWQGRIFRIWPFLEWNFDGHSGIGACWDGLRGLGIMACVVSLGFRHWSVRYFLLW